MENFVESNCSKSKFTGNIKSRKRFRIQCWSDDQCEKIKILKGSSEDKAVQTDMSIELDVISKSVRNSVCEALKSKFETNFDCGICKEIYLDSCILPCGHIFCSYCIRMWFLHADTCPICRITTEFVIGTKIIDNFVKDALGMFDAEAVESREAQISDRKSILQKVEANWVVQSTNSYYTTPEMWRDWLDLQNNNVELINNNYYDESVDRTNDRTLNNLWPWQSEDSLVAYAVSNGNELSQSHNAEGVNNTENASNTVDTVEGTLNTEDNMNIENHQ